MLTAKRVLIATICGFIFGLVCMCFASCNPDPAEPITVYIKWTIILSRTLMGFTIGISAIRLSWWLHGAVIGLIGSIPMALPILDKPEIAVGTIVMGVVYGFLIELIASKFFKSKSVGMLKAD